MPPTPWDEAEISVNGVGLTIGQSMALRVALTTYLALEDDGDEDELEKGYQARIREVLALIAGPAHAA